MGASTGVGTSVGTGAGMVAGTGNGCRHGAGTGASTSAGMARTWGAEIRKDGRVHSLVNMFTDTRTVLAGAARLVVLTLVARTSNIAIRCCTQPPLKSAWIYAWGDVKTCGREA